MAWRLAARSSGVLLLGNGLVLALGCGARAEEPDGELSAEPEAVSGTTAPAISTPPAGSNPTPPAPQSTAGLPDSLLGMEAGPPSGPDYRPTCSINQELICEALGNSSAERCECRTIVPRTAADCALPEQLTCGDAGAQCYCNDRAGCSPGFLPACESYAPQSGCGCFFIYTR
jgi:hypothetical protein